VVFIKNIVFVFFTTIRVSFLVNYDSGRPKYFLALLRFCDSFDIVQNCFSLSFVYLFLVACVLYTSVRKFCHVVLILFFNAQNIFSVFINIENSLRKELPCIVSV